MLQQYLLLISTGWYDTTYSRYIPTGFGSWNFPLLPTEVVVIQIRGHKVVASPFSRL